MVPILHATDSRCRIGSTAAPAQPSAAWLALAGPPTVSGTREPADANREQRKLLNRIQASPPARSPRERPGIQNTLVFANLGNVSMPVEMAMWRMTAAGPQPLEASPLDFEQRLEDMIMNDPSHASPKNRPVAALCRATRWVQTTSGAAAGAARPLKPYRPLCLCELFTMSVPRDVVIALSFVQQSMCGRATS